VQGAEALKEISPHQFEWWVVMARASICDIWEGREPRRG